MLRHQDVTDFVRKLDVKILEEQRIMGNQNMPKARITAPNDYPTSPPVFKRKAKHLPIGWFCPRLFSALPPSVQQGLKIDLEGPIPFFHSYSTLESPKHKYDLMSDQEWDQFIGPDALEQAGYILSTGPEHDYAEVLDLLARADDKEDDGDEALEDEEMQVKTQDKAELNHFLKTYAGLF